MIVGIRPENITYAEEGAGQLTGVVKSHFYLGDVDDDDYYVIDLDDDTSAQTFFKMSSSAVKVKAVYRAHTHAYDCRAQEEQFLKEEGVYYLSCACGASSKGTDGEAVFTALPQEPTALPESSQAPSGDESTDDKTEGTSSLVIVGVSLGGVLIAAGIAVAVILVLKKKKKQ